MFEASGAGRTTSTESAGMPVDGWDAAALDRLAEQLGDLAGLRRLAGQGQAAADAASVAASDVLGAAADPGQR